MSKCKHWRELDREFGTDPDSPLHHDNRCEECGARLAMLRLPGMPPIGPYPTIKEQRA